MTASDGAMTAQGADAPATATATTTAEATAPTGETPASDDLLCTICNLKACWQAPAP